MKNAIKRAVALSLSSVMLLFLCSCGAKNQSVPTATVERNDGVTEDVTPAQLIQLYEEDEAEFDRLYEGAPITIEADVIYESSELETKTKSGRLYLLNTYYLHLGMDCGNLYWLILEDEVSSDDSNLVQALNAQGYEFYDLNEGTHMKLKSKIDFAGSDCIFLDEHYIEIVEIG